MNSPKSKVSVAVDFVDLRDYGEQCRIPGYAGELHVELPKKFRVGSG